MYPDQKNEIQGISLQNKIRKKTNLTSGYDCHSYVLKAKKQLILLELQMQLQVSQVQK
jgi:hypothetical protein